MSVLLAFFLGNPTIIAIGAAVLVALGFGYQQRLSGAKAERAKQAAEETKARDVKDQVQGDIDALPADKARGELKSWSRD